LARYFNTKNLKAILNMKYAVTGGAGFIGSHLTKQLLDQGHEVVVIDDLSTGNRDHLYPKSHFQCFDISKQSWPQALIALLRDVDTVFHMAAAARVQPSIQKPLDYHNVNVNGTLNLLIASHDAGVRRVVYSASSSSYGQTEDLPTKESTPASPLSPYGLQKLIGEQYCSLFSSVYELETVSLRYFNVYGERMPTQGAYALAIAKFAQQMKDGSPITIWGDGEQRRDFTYVKDVVNANILAADSTDVGAGEVINIGSGNNLSVNQVAELLGGEVTFLDPVPEARNTLADNTKAKQLLGWEPTMRLEDWIPEYKKQLGL